MSMPAIYNITKKQLILIASQVMPQITFKRLEQCSRFTTSEVQNIHFSPE